MERFDSESSADPGRPHITRSRDGRGGILRSSHRVQKLTFDNIAIYRDSISVSVELDDSGPGSTHRRSTDMRYIDTDVEKIGRERGGHRGRARGPLRQAPHGPGRDGQPEWVGPEEHPGWEGRDDRPGPEGREGRPPREGRGPREGREFRGGRPGRGGPGGPR